MTSFQLVNSTFGWQGAGIPDDLTVVVSETGSQRELYISLRDLLIAYGYLLNGIEEERGFGSNVLIDFRPEENAVTVHSGSFHGELEFAEAEREFKTLLQDIFYLFDEMDGSSDRNPQLTAIQSAIRGTDVEYDVKGLYRRLTQ